MARSHGCYQSVKQNAFLCCTFQLFDATSLHSFTHPFTLGLSDRNETTEEWQPTSYSKPKAIVYRCMRSFENLKHTFESWSVDRPFNHITKRFSLHGPLNSLITSTAFFHLFTGNSTVQALLNLESEALTRTLAVRERQMLLASQFVLVLNNELPRSFSMFSATSIHLRVLLNRLFDTVRGV